MLTKFFRDFSNAALKVRGLPEVFPRSSLTLFSFFPSQCPPLCGLLANSFERVSLPAALRTWFSYGKGDLTRRPSQPGRHLGGKWIMNWIFPQTSRGSFSAVSTPIFASKYSLESSRRDLHNALLCTVLESTGEKWGKKGLAKTTPKRKKMRKREANKQRAASHLELQWKGAAKRIAKVPFSNLNFFVKNRQFFLRLN